MGAILASLILTYGPHGPARHPKMLLISLLPVAGVSLAALIAKQYSRGSIAIQCWFWAVAIFSTFALINTSIGDGVPPITSTLLLVVLGMLSFGAVYIARFEEPMKEQPEIEADEELE